MSLELLEEKVDANLALANLALAARLLEHTGC